MSSPMAKINSLLEYWASLSPSIMDFTVDHIVKALNNEATYKDILRFLMSKNGFELNASMMYLCSNNHKAYLGDIDESIDEYDYITCHVCGEDLVNDESHAYIVFNFTDEFRDSVKKKDYLRNLLDQVAM